MCVCEKECVSLSFVCGRGLHVRADVCSAAQCLYTRVLRVREANPQGFAEAVTVESQQEAASDKDEAAQGALHLLHRCFIKDAGISMKLQ